MISWIKLDINILDDAKIKIIRSQPNGDSVVLLWIGLLCLAMKSSRPGTIEIADGLPYTIDDLSNLFNIEKKTVEMGLALFVKYRMVETFEGGSIDVINFAKHQKLEEIERKRELTRIRTIKYRERLRICDVPVTRHGVTVTRRVSGGGAMFIQPGNTITYSLYVPTSLVEGLSFEQSYAFLDD